MKLSYVSYALIVMYSFDIHYVHAACDNQPIVSCLPAHTVLQLYQMIKDTHEVLMADGITYWMHAGTLLGAVRHGGHIPWDDDIDIVITRSQESRFALLKPVFEKLGYELIGPYAFGYKIFPKGNNKRSKWVFHDRPPWIDVMVFAERDGKYVYDPEKSNPPAWAYIYFKKSDLFPLKEYLFGEIHLMGPHDPLPYLDLVYSEWRKYACLKNGRKILLCESMKAPALPTGPLQDRYS